MIAAAKRLKSPQARFSDENEMALAIQQTLSTNLSEIISRANEQKSGINPYSGPSVSFSGFQNQQGKIIAISGQASIQVFIWYDGKGNWGLFTAYPKP